MQFQKMANCENIFNQFNFMNRVKLDKVIYKDHI